MCFEFIDSLNLNMKNSRCILYFLENVWNKITFTLIKKERKKRKEDYYTTLKRKKRNKEYSLKLKGKWYPT